MAKAKKSTTKKTANPKKAKKVSMLDAAIIGASTPTMGRLEAERVSANKPKKTKKVSMLDAAIMGAATPTMGKLGRKKK